MNYNIEIKPSCKESINKLCKKNPILKKAINKKKNLSKPTLFMEITLTRKKIPKSYNVQNLWRVELTNYWRMLYTIKGYQIEIICFILNIIDHNK